MQQRGDTVPRLCDPGPGSSPIRHTPKRRAERRERPSLESSLADTLGGYRTEQRQPWPLTAFQGCSPPRRSCRADSWASWLPLGLSDACSASPILNTGRACCDTSSLTPHASDIVSTCSTSASTSSRTTSTACSRASIATSLVGNNVGSPRLAGSTISPELRRTAAACSLDRSLVLHDRGITSIAIGRPWAGGGMRSARQ